MDQNFSHIMIQSILSRVLLREYKLWYKRLVGIEHRTEDSRTSQAKVFSLHNFFHVSADVNFLYSHQSELRAHFEQTLLRWLTVRLLPLSWLLQSAEGTVVKRILDF